MRQERFRLYDPVIKALNSLEVRPNEERSNRAKVKLRSPNRQSQLPLMKLMVSVRQNRPYFEMEKGRHNNADLIYPRAISREEK